MISGDNFDLDSSVVKLHPAFEASVSNSSGLKRLNFARGFWFKNSLRLQTFTTVLVV